MKTTTKICIVYVNNNKDVQMWKLIDSVDEIVKFVTIVIT